MARLLCFASLAILHGALIAQSNPTLLADIHLGSGPNPSSSPRQVVSTGTRLFFVVTDPVAGEELFVSAGVPGSSRLLRDIRPGTSGSEIRDLTSPRDFIPVGDKLFFIATDRTNAVSPGMEVFVSDGTTAGTRVTRDIRLGRDSSQPRTLVAWRGAAYFIAFAGSTRLWRSDGTTAGTVAVVDVPTRATICEMVAFGPSLILAQSSNYRSFLYRYSGTGSFAQYATVGVQPPGSDTSGSSIRDLTVAGNRVFFAADDVHQGHGFELWVTDGTAIGTRLTRDIHPGGSDTRGNSSVPRSITAFGNTVFFTANDGSSGVELYKSDGSPTRMARSSFTRMMA